MSSYLSHPSHARRTQKPCHDRSSISTKSAFEQLIYTVYVQEITSKLQLLQKNARYSATSRQTSNHVDMFPSESFGFPKLVHSIQSLSRISFSLCFLLFNILFHPRLSSSLSLTVIAFSLSCSVSFFWISEESEKVGLCTLQACVILALHVPNKHLSARRPMTFCLWLSDMQS